MNLRRTLMPYHRWAGLTLGLVVLVSAFTGAGMAFRKQLDPLVYPRISQAPVCAAPVSLDQIADAARKLHPHGELDYLRIQDGPSAPIAARFLDKDTLYFSRCGAPVASQNRYQGLFGTLEWIHRGRWTTFGGTIMGLGALTLLLLIGCVGIYLWWPRRPRRFRDGFTVSAKAKGPAFNILLHRATGGWVVIPLMISALTGLPNAFDGVHDAIVALDGGKGAEHVSQPPAADDAAKLPLAAAWREIIGLMPSASEVLIHVARKPADAIEIYVIEKGAPHANARSYLYLDAYSGKILEFTPYSRMGFGSRIYFWMLSVHTGEVGGVAGQMLLLSGALGALVLGYTGITAYLRRRFKLDKKRKRAPTGTSAAAETSLANREKAI